MANPTNLLQNLRGIHLPSPISMWPKTFGWYILIALLIILTLTMTVKLYRYYFKKSCQKKLINELHRLTTLYFTSPTESLAKISILLRRIALAAFPRKEVAGLNGEAWLKFLDREVQEKNGRFVSGVGRVLISAPYQSKQSIMANRSKMDVDIKALAQIIENWIRRII